MHSIGQEGVEFGQNIDTMKEFDTVGRGFNEQPGDFVDFHCGVSWMGAIDNEQKKEQARHGREHDGKWNTVGPRTGSPLGPPTRCNGNRGVRATEETTAGPRRNCNWDHQTL